MLIGAACGAQIGTVATKYIKGYGIRIAFGIAVLGCMSSIIMKLLPRYIDASRDSWMIFPRQRFSSSSVVALGYIAVKMVQGAKREIAMKSGKA